MEDRENSLQQHNCGCGCSSPTEVEKVEKAEAQTVTQRRTYLPAVDIVDSASETLLVMDLPGVAESDVELSVEKGTLTVKASQADLQFEEQRLVYAEYGVGEYRRSFSLSEDVNKDGITASLKDGVLQVKLPKAAPVAKKIAVSSL